LVLFTAKVALHHPYFNPPAPTPALAAPAQQSLLGQPLSPFLNPWGTNGPPNASQFAQQPQQAQPQQQQYQKVQSPAQQRFFERMNESPQRSGSGGGGGGGGNGQNVPTVNVEALMASPI